MKKWLDLPENFKKVEEAFNISSRYEATFIFVEKRTIDVIAEHTA